MKIDKITAFDFTTTLQHTYN